MPDTLVVSPTSITFRSLTAVQVLLAREAHGRPIAGRLVRWSSSDERVVTVDADGYVRAIRNGAATVHASLGSTLVVDVPVVVEQVPRALRRVSPHHQAGRVTDTLPIPLTAEVVDSLGWPVGSSTTPVTFTTTNGTVVPHMTIVDSTGRASARWVLGTVAGESAAYASLPAGFPMDFLATVHPDSAHAMTKFYGDQQRGLQNAALEYALSVRVSDRFDNNVPGYPVNFAVTGGGGSVGSASALTDEYGRATTTWVLGQVGPQSMQALGSTPLAGAPVTFGAEAVAFYVTGFDPDSIQEGGTFTLLGGGFDPVPANNAVSVAGIPGAVVGASEDALTVLVPDLGCEPSPTVSAHVTVAGVQSNSVFPPLKPRNPVTLAVGQQLIVPGEASLCLHFPSSGAPSRFIIGVQSTSADAADVTQTRTRGRNWFAVGTIARPPSPVLATSRPSGIALPVLDNNRQRRWARHREAELRVREWDRQILSRFRTATPLARSAAAAGLIDSTRQVGDTIHDLRVFAGDCETFRPVTAVVRARGRNAYWVEDVQNPGGGYTPGDLDSLSRFFDNIIFATDTAYFGTPTDTDGNRRVVVLVTKEVNRLSSGLLGFVVTCDFFARPAAAASNEGEYFYARAPDPTGAYTDQYTRNDAFADAPLLIAHEVTHIIQLSRRIPAGSDFSTWQLEGQATFAEGVNGFAVTGRQPGNNYGLDVAFNTPPTTSAFWHVPMFSDLAVYYGFESPSTRRLGAPHECTWIGLRSEGNAGPCLPGREVYGVPAAFYRWLSDQFGSSFPGGERGLHKAIVSNRLGGYANIAAVTGRPIDSLLAQWAAALYLDDRIPALDARMKYTTWNMLSVFNGLVETARLVPHDVGFGPFDVTMHIRGGSTAYFQISGNYNAITTLRVRDALDRPLQPHVNLWVVRIE